MAQPMAPSTRPRDLKKRTTTGCFALASVSASAEADEDVVGFQYGSFTFSVAAASAELPDSAVGVDVVDDDGEADGDNAASDGAALLRTGSDEPPLAAPDSGERAVPAC